MLIATTKLDAINIILASIGADPINSIMGTMNTLVGSSSTSDLVESQIASGDVDVDVSNAVRMLDTTSRNIQRKGWDFNRGEYTLTPDVNSKRIRMNPSVISFKAKDGGQYGIRGGFLYDMQKHTDKFEKPVNGELTMFLDFEDLPDAFKNYIAIKAACDFQMQYLADASVSQSLQQQLMEAHSDIVDYDMNMGNYNMLQLTSIASMLDRR